jgi:hypothetical protein
MNSFLSFLQDNFAIILSSATSIVVICISFSALRLNRTMARRNIRLAIQQAIFKIVSEKARDCNVIWEDEIKPDSGQSIARYKLVSELTISREVIDKSFELFKKNYKAIENARSDYYYLLWKQLRTDLREFVRNVPSLTNQVNDKNYLEQINDLHRVFGEHFEKNP